MKDVKIFRSIAVALLLLMTTSLWAYDYEVDGIYYKVYKHEASVTYGPSGTRYSGNIEIPQTIVVDSVEYKVTMIGESAFYSCNELEYVSLPSGLVSIGDSAFSWCTNLNFIVIPQTVMTIGSYAFSDCDSLSSVEMYGGIVSIGSHAFENDSNLTSLSIPRTVMNIGFGAFDGCTSLSPMGVTPTN